MWLQRGRVPCGREARLQAGVRRKERDRIFNCLLRAERESKVEVGCPQCRAFCSKAVATKSPQTGLPTRDQMPEPMGGHSHSTHSILGCDDGSMTCLTSLEFSESAVAPGIHLKHPCYNVIDLIRGPLRNSTIRPSSEWLFSLAFYKAVLVTDMYLIHHHPIKCPLCLSLESS